MREEVLQDSCYQLDMWLRMRDTLYNMSKTK